ncbi:hypothetical protein BJV74DRAFT_83408 [Russula compacta]|nr:hypothetical protein BJV74DRAFT_83408 [Russula compacta]
MPDSSSPPLKRRRMSSPTYDEQLEIPSQDELRVIGKLELSLSQAPPRYSMGTSKVPATGISSQYSFGLEKPLRASESSDRPVSAPSPPFPRQHLAVEHDDPDDPFTSTCEPCTGFAPASVAHNQHPTITRFPSDSEGEQSEGDIAVGHVEDSITPNIRFTSASNLVTSSVGFTSASALAGQTASVTHQGSSSPPHPMAFEDGTHNTAEFDSVGCMLNNAGHKPFSAFTSLGKQKNLFQPSAAAMKTALKRAKLWAAEDDDLFLHLQDDAPEETPDVTISPHQALLAVENLSPRRTSTNPTASGSANKSHIVSGNESMKYNVMGHPSLGQADAGGSFRSAAHFSIPSALGTRSFQTPSRSGIEGSAFMKPFKSPLVNPSATKDSGDSQHASSFLDTVASTHIRGSNPVALDPSFSQVSSRSRFSTPVPMRGTPMRKAPAKKFVTPFKPGMRPGEPGHRQLKARYDTEMVNTPSGLSTEGASSINDGSRKPTRRRFFDLTAVRDRKTLASSGFRPGIHAPDALAIMGM